MENLFKRVGWGLVTAFFLVLAWATSIDEGYNIGTIPISATPEGDVIWLRNESDAPLTDLSLTLNGIYSISGVTIDPQAELRIPLVNFVDRHQSSISPTERPNLLEVYSNGAGGLGSGGYKKIEFD